MTIFLGVCCFCLAVGWLHAEIAAQEAHTLAEYHEERCRRLCGEFHAKQEDIFRRLKEIQAENLADEPDSADWWKGN